MARYEPERFDGDVVYFTAAEDDPTRTRGAAGWRDAVTGVVRNHPVPSTHWGDDLAGSPRIHRADPEQGIDGRRGRVITMRQARSVRSGRSMSTRAEISAMYSEAFRRAGLCAGMVLTLGVAPLGQAVAAPVPGGHSTSAAAAVDRIERVDERRWDMFVYSPSMERVIPLQVIRPPADTGVPPRPTLYLLNGAGGGEDGANWLNQTDILDFMGDKNANVVIPAEGMYTYYTDWQQDDPKLGRQKWQTFLTQELPPVVDEALGANGINAIAGLSMSATSALDLAIQAPGLYRAAASYSGCAQTGSPLGQTYIRSVVEVMGGNRRHEHVGGPFNGPGWKEHDPTLNAENLRGLSLYISNGTGLPGPYENPALPRTPHSRRRSPIRSSSAAPSKRRPTCAPVRWPAG